MRQTKPGAEGVPSRPTLASRQSGALMQTQAMGRLSERCHTENPYCLGHGSLGHQNCSRDAG